MNIPSVSPLVRFSKFAFATVASITLASCAGMAPDAKFSQSMPSAAGVISGDSVHTTVHAAPTVAALGSDRERIAQAIMTHVESTAKPGTRPTRDYQISVELTRYDKGDATARMMLAGLGQIHVNGEVSVYRSPDHAKVAEFTASKTFAWGGIYGGSVSVEKIEQTFAQSIANAVCKHL